MRDTAEGNLKIRGDSRSFAAYLNPLNMLWTLWRERELVLRFTRREIERRYKGTSLGIVWSLVSPLILLGIYTLVFGVVFKAKWPESGTGGLSEFALTLFCGLIVFNVFNECISSASSLILWNPNYVRKVVFPLEILPVTVLASSLFHAFLSLIVLLAASGAIHHHLPWTVVYVPVVVLPLLCLVVGLSWILASLGVFFRDVQQVVSLVLAALFFVTPIFYSSAGLPDSVRRFIAMNPLAFVIEGLRRVVLWGRTPVWDIWAAWSMVCLAVLVFGYAFFMRTKRVFADLV